MVTSRNNADALETSMIVVRSQNWGTFADQEESTAPGASMSYTVMVSRSVSTGSVTCCRGLDQDGIALRGANVF